MYVYIYIYIYYIHVLYTRVCIYIYIYIYMCMLPVPYCVADHDSENLEQLALYGPAYRDSCGEGRESAAEHQWGVLSLAFGSHPVSWSSFMIRRGTWQIGLRELGGPPNSLLGGRRIWTVTLALSGFCRLFTGGSWTTVWTLGGAGGAGIDITLGSSDCRCFEVLAISVLLGHCSSQAMLDMQAVHIGLLYSLTLLRWLLSGPRGCTINSSARPYLDTRLHVLHSV